MQRTHRGIKGLVAIAALAVVAAPATLGAQTSDDGKAPKPVTPSAAPAPVQGAAVPSDGALYFSIDNSSALYLIDVTTAAPTLLGETGVDSQTVGLTEGPDPTKVIGSTWTDLTIINVDGSGFESQDDDLMEAEGLAYDPTNDVLYKIINDDFATASQTTGETIDVLATAQDDPEGLAFRTTDGNVYALASESALLYRYTPSSDSWATVGDTGIADTNSNGLAWDPLNDVLYAITEEGILYRIDPDTAASEVIGDTGFDDGGGLAFIAPPPAPEPEPEPIVLAPTFTG